MSSPATKTPADDIPAVIAWPPLIFAACSAAGVGLHLAFPIYLAPRAPVRLTGLVLAVFAALFAGWASVAMHRAGTNVRPDRPTTAIVTQGPYRFTRNPMYLSLCLLQAGIALLVGGLLPLLMTLVLASILHGGVILREEKYLADKFGTFYTDYCHRVRRWL